MPASSDPTAEEPLVSITILLSKPVGAREAELRQALQVLGAFTLDGMMPGLPFMANEEGCCGSVRWDDHHVRLLEVAAQAPGLDQMIQSTRMDHAALAPLRKHASHLLCYYQGDAADPILRVQAIFRLAAALVPLGVVGVIHTDAWQCFTPSALTAVADPELTKEMREGSAQLALCNLIPFHGKQGTWWASKGNHVFGVPDFALWDEGRFGLKSVQTTFASLFSYLQGGATILPGHTMELSGVVFVVGEVTEFHEYLCGPGATLALRPLGAAGRGAAGGDAGEKSGGCGILVLPLFFGLFFIGLIFAVPTYYDTMKVVLGIIGGLCLLVAFLPLLLRRRG